MTNLPDGIAVRHTPAANTVLTAPDESLISLEVVQQSAPELLTIAGDRLHLGLDEEGRRLIYQVTGWQAHPPALTVRRVAP